VSRFALFKKGELNWEAGSGEWSTVHFARPIRKKLTGGMGAGLLAIENIAYDWTVTYDEVLYVLEGELRVTVGEEVFNCELGDFVWLPKDTALNYATDTRAMALFVVAPESAVDWKAFGLE
jgi:ethanolamine utilization protein EutQ (cupin superfamily)